MCSANISNTAFKKTTPLHIKTYECKKREAVAVDYSIIIYEVPCDNMATLLSLLNPLLNLPSSSRLILL